MSERLRRVAAAALMLAALGVASACARPLGDFGRAGPSVLHDEIMPTLGKARADLSREPVSAFNLTDQEREMHDRVWRYLVAPHAQDWFMDTVVELQRTRLAGAKDRTFTPDRYYRWLHRTRYESSRIRFRTLADHADSDVDTAASTFAPICRVIGIDRQRSIASRELDGLAYDDVAARRAENEIFIAWFTRSIRYRFDSYQFALDRLLVETPHEEALEADAEITALAIYVDRAERGDFCSGTGATRGIEDRAVPGRILVAPAGEGIYLK